MDSDLNSLFYIVIVILLVSNIVVLAQNWLSWKRVRKNIYQENYGWIDKYYELKYKISFLISLITIGAVVSGLFGIPYFNDLKKELSTLQKDVDSLRQNITGTEDRVFRAKDNVVEIEENIENLSTENRKLKQDIENNIVGIYEQLSQEEKRSYLKQIANTPSSILIYESELYHFELSNSDYELLKKAYDKLIVTESLQQRRAAQQVFLYVFFRKFPEKLFDNIDLIKEFCQTGHHEDFLYSTPPQDLINGWKEFLLYCLGNGGIEENSQLINMFESSMFYSSIYDPGMEKSVPPYYSMLLSVLQTKDNIVKFHNVLRIPNNKLFLKVILIDRYSNTSKDSRRMTNEEIDSEFRKIIPQAVENN